MELEHRPSMKDQPAQASSKMVDALLELWGRGCYTEVRDTLAVINREVAAQWKKEAAERIKDPAERDNFLTFLRN